MAALIVLETIRRVPQFPRVFVQVQPVQRVGTAKPNVEQFKTESLPLRQLRGATRSLQGTLGAYGSEPKLGRDLLQEVPRVPA